MAKVLYISYDGMTDPLGQSQVLPYLAGLSAKGHKITLLSCEKENRYKQSAGLIKDLTKNYGINWVPLSYTSKPKVVSTVMDVQNLKRNAVKLNKINHFDIVHCRSYIAAIAGLYLKKKYGIRFIFDMRGFWADERIDGELWSLNNPVYKIVYNYFKRLEIDFLKHSDYVVSLTETGKEEILSWPAFKNNNLNIEVIPCCCDTELFNPDDILPHHKIEIRKDLGIAEGSLVITYLGSVGTWYLLPEMLAFFKKLLISRPDSVFLFITPDNPSDIKAKAFEAGIDKDKIIVKESKRKDVPLMVSAGDISMFFIKPAYSKKASSPTKQAEIMSLGQPVICNAGVGDTEKIIKESGAGIVVNGFSDIEFNMAIEQIDKMLDIPSQKIREAALARFDLNTGVELYDRIYKKITIS